MYRDLPNVICPVCGGDYIHIDKVAMLSSDGGAIVVTAGDEDGSAPGTVEHRTQHDASGRRHTIRLYCYCEDEHGWHIDLTQTKGQTYIRVVQTPLNS